MFQSFLALRPCSLHKLCNPLPYPPPRMETSRTKLDPATMRVKERPSVLRPEEHTHTHAHAHTGRYINKHNIDSCKERKPRKDPDFIFVSFPALHQLHPHVCGSCNRPPGGWRRALHRRPGAGGLSSARGVWSVLQLCDAQTLLPTRLQKGVVSKGAGLSECLLHKNPRHGTAQGGKTQFPNSYVFN